MTQLVEASITAQNTWSEPVKCRNAAEEGDVAVHISGTFSATVTVQRSLDKGGTWGAEGTTYTSATEVRLTRTQGAWYRAGVATGGFTSGTVVLKLL